MAVQVDDEPTITVPIDEFLCRSCGQMKSIDEAANFTVQSGVVTIRCNLCADAHNAKEMK